MEKQPTLANPLMLPAGGYAPPDFFDASHTGAFVTLPTTQRPRAGAPMPRVIDLLGGLLLRTGSANPGLAQILHDYRRANCHGAGGVTVRQPHFALLAFAFATLVMIACGIPGLMEQAIAPTATPTSTAPQILTTPTPRATATQSARAQANAPTWWPSEIVMPKTAEFTGGAKGSAVWTMHDLNVEGIKDFFVQEAMLAGYTVHIVPESQGAIYDLLFVKGANAYALNITKGSETTLLAGSRVGVMHLQVTGTLNLELDLPLRGRLDTSAGGEIFIGTSVPNPRCFQCEYLMYIHIAPFKGPGVYDGSKPGLYQIDAEMIVGGRHEFTDDFRWAKQCTVVVSDANNGNFACAGLEDITNNTRRINVVGSWQQPPLP